MFVGEMGSFMSLRVVADALLLVRIWHHVSKILEIVVFGLVVLGFI